MASLLAGYAWGFFVLLIDRLIYWARTGFPGGPESKVSNVQDDVHPRHHRGVVLCLALVPRRRPNDDGGRRRLSDAELLQRQMLRQALLPRRLLVRRLRGVLRLL